MAMNSVNMVGRLTSDPSIVESQNNGNKTARFTLAVDRNYTPKDGQPSADFVRCVAFGAPQVEALEAAVKGSQLAVSGHIQTGSYKNRDGQTVYTTDIVIDRFDFIGRKPESAKSVEAVEAVEDEDDIPFV